ncbi:MAG: hypothetical protein IJC39_01420 [Firmicutes bacterium]|nr:hypothetical protein [Bacillota bacterium]
MPLYWIFIALAITVAVFSGEIDKRANAKGKLKKTVIIVCVVMVVLISLLIKSALQAV